MILESMD
jgi:superfamily II DNA helicase RecQ